MNNNSVEVIGTYGSDTTHACSAWTSTSRTLTESKLSRIDKLIDRLMEDKHHTPFEKSVLHFLVTTDIATHIHLLKYRVGVSINAESARYKELGERKGKGVDKYYIPQDWPEEHRENLRNHVVECYKKYHNTLNNLVSTGIPRKRAKESARFYLPYATQITADVMFNFRSFIHFQILRNSEHAQVEVRELAQEMRELIEVNHPEFRATLAAFDAMLEKERLKDVAYAALEEMCLIGSGDTLQDVVAAVQELLGGRIKL